MGPSSSPAASLITIRACSLWILLLSAVFANLVLAEPQKASSSGTTAAAATTSNGGNGGNGGSATSSSPAATTTANCIQNSGGSPGYFILKSPIGTTLAPVGNNLMINWTYEQTDTTQFPASSIALYYALFSTSASGTGSQPSVTADTWYSNPIVTNLDKTALSYIWKIPSLQPGLYKIKIIGDGMDPQRAQLHGQTQCILSNQPLPYSSAEFRIVGNGPLVNYTDWYGPASDAMSSVPSSASAWIMGLVVAATAWATFSF
ncbi:hypothetical protein HDU76_012473 [Blyttiomyces sp. JEL0837]|nr:hypothetical protein HDU76_012473 [Blyttiomyces sp. JEL0837]